MTSRPDVFISYSHEDMATARRFAEALRREGLDVWWDVTLRSGDTYDEVIENAVRTSRAVVVLWSPRSVVSRWVRAEATLGDRNKVLVPATIEPCDKPIMFELTHTAELTHWQGNGQDLAWRGFVEDVKRVVASGTAKDALTAPDIPVPVPAVERGVPSLAILSFTNRSGEPADNVFAEGMVEDLIAALSTIWRHPDHLQQRDAHLSGCRL
ncbi:MAG: TIR domain-containing protein [Sphingomonadales bacterium]|nr:TIR domain-containing protein [Sphingomonadales bacterium]